MRHNHPFLHLFIKETPLVSRVAMSATNASLVWLTKTPFPCYNPKVKHKSILNPSCKAWLDFFFLFLS